MLLLYVPCASQKQAEKIGHALVSEKLAVCANVLPKMTSLFRWGGKIQKTKEALLLAKVLDGKKDRVRRRVRQLHSYSVPLISFYPAKDVNVEYLRWAKKS